MDIARIALLVILGAWLVPAALLFSLEMLFACSEPPRTLRERAALTVYYILTSLEWPISSLLELRRP